MAHALLISEYMMRWLALAYIVVVLVISAKARASNHFEYFQIDQNIL